MEEARTNIERADDARLALLSPDPAPNPNVQCELCLALHVRDEFLRDRFVRELHASWFIAVERRGECLGTVVIPVFEAHVRFHVAVVFHRRSGVSNVVPVVRIVYLGEATFPNTSISRSGSSNSTGVVAEVATGAAVAMAAVS